MSKTVDFIPIYFHHVVLNLSSTSRFSINIIWLNFTTLQEMIFSNSTGKFSIHIIWLKFITLQEMIFSNLIQIKFTRKSLYSIHIWILNCYHCRLNTMPLSLNLSPSNTYPPTCVSSPCPRRLPHLSRHVLLLPQFRWWSCPRHRPTFSRSCINL